MLPSILTGLSTGTGRPFSRGAGGPFAGGTPNSITIHIHCDVSIYLQGMAHVHLVMVHGLNLNNSKQ